jgi:hypothetical protein
LIVVQVAGDDTAVCAVNGDANGCCASGEKSWLGRMFERMFGGGSSIPVEQELGGPYGNGPYRRYQSHPDASAVEMAGLCRELAALEQEEDSPLAEHKAIDWPAFHDRCQKAATAGDAQKAIGHYAAAVRLLMTQVRSTQPDESGVHRVF